MTVTPEVEAEARRLFELVRSCWHYAPKGTPDGWHFEQSERGQFLMRSMRVIAMQSTQPEAPLMVTDEVVELVATALCIDDGQEPHDFAPTYEICGQNNEPVLWWRYYESPARAVLAALTKETEGRTK